MTTSLYVDVGAIVPIVGDGIFVFIPRDTGKYKQLPGGGIGSNIHEVHVPHWLDQGPEKDRLTSFRPVG